MLLGEADKVEVGIHLDRVDMHLGGVLWMKLKFVAFSFYIRLEAL